MRTISLRAFRDSMPTEPVAVVVRRGGELVTLGTWTPAGTTRPEVVDMVEGRLVERKADVPFSTRPFTPVPKSGKR